MRAILIKIIRKILDIEVNRIICAVNRKQTAEEAGVQTETELTLYKNMWAEAEAHFTKYGKWPVFDLVELEW